MEVIVRDDLIFRSIRFFMHDLLLMMLMFATSLFTLAGVILAKEWDMEHLHPVLMTLGVIVMFSTGTCVFV